MSFHFNQTDKESVFSKQSKQQSNFNVFSINFFSLDFEGKRSISEGLKRFLMRTMEKDPAKRYTVDQMKKDEWVNEGFMPLAGDYMSQRMSISPSNAALQRRASKPRF